MTAISPFPPSLHFGRIAPTMSVTDIDRSLGSYCGALGFDKAFENGDPVRFVILEREAAELYLALNPTHQPTQENVAHLMVSDAAALHGHLVASGVRIVKVLRDAAYGLHTVEFADPDGNGIDVGEAL